MDTAPFSTDSMMPDSPKRSINLHMDGNSNNSAGLENFFYVEAADTDVKQDLSIMSTSDVKSTAVVKYSSMEIPAHFSTIRLNTDLNHPPADRQHPSCFMFGDKSMPRTAAFSSFNSINMAHSNQDLVGKVDVISSSKNIKALLKMPYSKSPQISIMVHRLGQTLLLEEFDIHKHCMRKEAEQWKWLKTFFYKVIAKGEENKMKWLVSANTGDQNKEAPVADNRYMNLIRHSFAASHISSSALKTTENQSKPPVPEFSGDMSGFHHETLWKFEDISMLIDSDLPIFGSGNSRRPCISLRLRDSRSPPISVLTGLDYWLDNLMSNVPEVAMCYHVNGFVQKYEVIRTEDIPHLDGSGFDPEEVKDIAKNIMAFIKANAAVEGHTYWLYKSENDEMVKLYDLTDYCKGEIIEGDNPFTVPVGLLCYRVGRNLKVSGQRRSADSRAMLENCLRLLDESKHSQMCADAHFHLSDMWVPDKSVNDIWHDKKISEMPSDLYDEDPSEEGLGPPPGPEDNESPSAIQPKRSDREVKNTVALKELVVRGMIKKKAWDIVESCRIAGATDERCRCALSHIRKGLSIIDKDEARLKEMNFEQRQQSRSPSKAIPMPYSPLGPDVNSRLNTKAGNTTQPNTSEESQQARNPFTPIPLRYSSLKTEQSCESSSENESVNVDSSSNKSGLTSEDSSGASAEAQSGPKCTPEKDSGSSSDSFKSTWEFEEESWSDTWHTSNKFNLLRKGAITYFVLAKSFFEIKKHGQTLRHLRYAFHCYEACTSLNPAFSKCQEAQELYLMLLLLAANSRILLHNSWVVSGRDFQELGEEEAAILSSAQAVLLKPDDAWAYEWPTSQELNLSTAHSIYLQVKRLPVINKKTHEFRTEITVNHGIALSSLATTQTDIIKDRCFNHGATFEDISPFFNKAERNFKDAQMLFVSAKNANLAAQYMPALAMLHVWAADSHKPSTLTVPFCPEETKCFEKAINILERGMAMLERGETMDDHRENYRRHLRVLYHNMAQRYTYFALNVNSTEENAVTAKRLLVKSLSYCNPERSGRHQRNNRIYAAKCQMAMAQQIEVEIPIVKSVTRQRALNQKCEESYKLSCHYFESLKFGRSHIFVKVLWAKFCKKLWHKKRKTVPPSESPWGGGDKNLYRRLLQMFSDLVEPCEQLAGQSDPEDAFKDYETTPRVLNHLMNELNSLLLAFLKSDPTNASLKTLYQRSLRLVPQVSADDMPLQLAVVLVDLQSLITLDLKGAKD